MVETASLAMEPWAARPNLMADTRWAWALSALIGGIGAGATFPWAVLLGTAEYWNFPHGFIGGSWADMSTAVSGLAAYAGERWQWPLFHLSTLGGKEGSSVLYTDSTPLLALIERVLFHLTGAAVPLYGGWAGLCMVGMALASTALVRAFGARTLAAAFAASTIGVSMPPLLARWGHLSLMGQWIIPLALSAYVVLHRRRRLHPLSTWGIVTGLTVLSLLIHPYFFFMVAGLMFTVPLQAVLTHRMSWSAACGVVGGFVSAVVVALAAMGHLSFVALEPARGFGSFSTNLMSPFLPQMSGVVPLGPNFILQGTWGQYEGFAYLGLGLLFLMVLTSRAIVNGPVSRHPFLLTVVLGFTALAISDHVYAAEFHLFTLPLPEAVLRVVGIVRASGRFIWLPVYLTAGLAVAAASRHPRAGVILLAAALLQWADVRPLRAMVRATTVKSEPFALENEAWRLAMEAVDRVVLDPPWLCMPDQPAAEWFYRAGMQIQLIASRAQRSTNTVYAARGRADCTIPPLTDRVLIIHLHSPAVPTPPTAECQSSPDMTACSKTLPPALLRRLVQVDTTIE